MKTNRSILALFLFLWFPSGLNSQTIIYGNDENRTNKEEYPGVNTESSLNKSIPKISYRVDMGSSFSSGKYYGNMLAFYTMPQIKYRLNPKINISAGVLAINTTNTYNFNSEKRSTNYKNAYFMAGIDYTKERLRISGEILYGMNNSPYHPFSNKNNQEYAIRFNAEYKITENLSIGLQVINQNMNQAYYPTPFGYGPYNPFNRNSPFSSYY